MNTDYRILSSMIFKRVTNKQYKRQESNPRFV